MWSDYYAAYAPSVWGNATTVSGSPESARACAAAIQKKVVMLYVPSNTSIIGLGSTAKITHGDLVLGTSSASVDNIVIRNVAFEDAFDFFPQWDPTDSTTGRWNSAYDLVSVMYATHVWIDHNTFSDGSNTDDLYPSVWTGTASDSTNYATNEVYKVQHHDGLIDVTKIGNYVTISYNYFHDHDKAFLIGGTDTASTDGTAEHPGVLNVSFHHNYFLNITQRKPRVRFGMVHIYNNYYSDTFSSSAAYASEYDWMVGQSGKIYAENNSIVTTGGTASVSKVYNYSVTSSKITTCASTFSTALCSAYFYDSGTLLNGTAIDVTTAIVNAASGKVLNGSSYWLPSSYYSYTLDSAPTAAPTSTVGAGVL
jgi:pectate lyase